MVIAAALPSASKMSKHGVDVPSQMQSVTHSRTLPVLWRTKTGLNEMGRKAALVVLSDWGEVQEIWLMGMKLYEDGHIHRLAS